MAGSRRKDCEEAGTLSRIKVLEGSRCATNFFRRNYQHGNQFLAKAPAFLFHSFSALP